MNNKVMPALNFDEWEAAVRAVLSAVSPHSEGVPDALYKSSRCSRVTGKLLVAPLCCSPCFLWSTLWRVACAPVAVFKDGCFHMCSNNGCTNCSDAAIAEAYRGMDAVKSVPGLATPVENLDVPRLERALALVGDALAKLSDPGLSLQKRYALSEALGPALVGGEGAKHTPYGLQAELARVQGRLVHCKRAAAQTFDL